MNLDVKFTTLNDDAMTLDVGFDEPLDPGVKYTVEIDWPHQCRSDGTTKLLLDRVNPRGFLSAVVPSPKDFDGEVTITFFSDQRADEKRTERLSLTRRTKDRAYLDLRGAPPPAPPAYRVPQSASGTQPPPTIHPPTQTSTGGNQPPPTIHPPTQTGTGGNQPPPTIHPPTQTGAGGVAPPPSPPVPPGGNPPQQPPRIEVSFSPPLPEAGKAFTTTVEFDPLPDVDSYFVTLTLPAGFVPPSVSATVTSSSRAANGRLRHSFTNTAPSQPGRYDADVTITPAAGAGYHPHVTPVTVIRDDRAGLMNALKENFDDVVGNKLKGAVESIAIQLQATNTNGIRLARAADPFAGNPARRRFWRAIRQSSSALSFQAYQAFMDRNFCAPAVPTPGNMAMPFSQVDTYLRLKAFTELFLLQNAGILPVQPPGAPLGLAAAGAMNAGAVLNQILAARPYLQVVLQNNPDLMASGVLNNICERLRYPVMIELIWSYFHEESMMAQTLKVIRDRFQNRIRQSGRDPLAQFEMDPLRPLNNILWGYIQDEQHRLGVRQRSYEYLHHYGIALEGRAVGTLRPADSRKRFLQAFHTLLYHCVQFFRQADDTTVVPNANNVLWALKDLHLVLAEGAHNQFGDLPWNARLEMLMEQWILSRPEIQDFLRARRMVPYPEAWMGTVDTMKTLQGWSSTNVIHFRDLGVFGEQILLSVREGGIAAGIPAVAGSGGWSVVTDPDEAAAFAITWRSEIEGYINAYRATTGVDLAQDPSDPRFIAERDLAPSAHLKRRLAAGAR